MALYIQEMKMFENFKYHLINLFAILFFFSANHAFFANEYGQNENGNWAV